MHYERHRIGKNINKTGFVVSIMASTIQTFLCGGFSRLVVLYCLLEWFGARCDDDDDDDKSDGRGKLLGLSITYGALIIGFTVIAGLFSLGAFLFFTCKKWISRKLGIYPAEITERGVVPPIWVKSICPDPEISDYGFGTASDGITLTTPNSIVRHRPGRSESDGARWSHGFTHGKHVFEVVWPKLQRGAYAQIGVGTLNAPLNCSRATSLVGMTEHSWGLDIVRRRVIHKGEVRSTCPPRTFVPDRFLMYVDLDSGKLGFGTDEVFWGIVASDLNQPDVYPLYIMAGMSEENSHMQVLYRGSAVTVDGVEATPKAFEAMEQYPPSYDSLDPDDVPGVVTEPSRTPESPPPPYKY